MTQAQTDQQVEQQVEQQAAKPELPAAGDPEPSITTTWAYGKTKQDNGLIGTYIASMFVVPVLLMVVLFLSNPNPPPFPK